MYVYSFENFTIFIKKNSKKLFNHPHECTDFPKRIHIGCLHMSFLLQKPIKRLVHCAPANIAYFVALSKFKREQVKMSDNKSYSLVKSFECEYAKLTTIIKRHTYEESAKS